MEQKKQRIKRKTSENSICISGVKLKALLKEKKVSGSTLADAIGVRDNLISYFVTYTKRALPEEVEKMSAFLGVNKEYLYANEEEIKKIEEKEEITKEYKRSIYVPVVRDKNETRNFILTTNLKKIDEIQSNEVILKGFLFLFAKEYMDLADLSAGCGIPIKRLTEIQAFNKTTKEELKKIYSFLIKSSHYCNVSELLTMPTEKEATQKEIVHYSKYASELYSETRDPKTFRPFYFWKRACLSENKNNNYKMPDWFIPFAEKQRDNFQIKQKDYYLSASYRY